MKLIMSSCVSTVIMVSMATTMVSRTLNHDGITKIVMLSITDHDILADEGAW